MRRSPTISNWSTLLPADADPVIVMDTAGSMLALAGYARGRPSEAAVTRLRRAHAAALLRSASAGSRARAKAPTTAHAARALITHAGRAWRRSGDRRSAPARARGADRPQRAAGSIRTAVHRRLRRTTPTTADYEALLSQRARGARLRRTAPRCGSLLASAGRRRWRGARCELTLRRRDSAPAAARRC